MTQIISMSIYRTETLTISGDAYTVQFTSTSDGQDHALMVSNDKSNKQGKYHFSSDVANDLKHYHGKELADEVLKIIKGDIEK